MKKVSIAFVLAAIAGTTMTASAVPSQLQAASNCFAPALSPVGSSLKNNSGGNQTAYCALNVDTTYSKIDQITVATDTVGPGMCSLRDNNGNIIYADSKSGNYYIWSTDRATDRAYTIYCNVTVGKYLWWSQTYLKN